MPMSYLQNALRKAQEAGIEENVKALQEEIDSRSEE